MPQILNCRAEARNKGWIVDSRHIYSDEGCHARKAFGDRLGLGALLAAARNQPRPFEVVIVAEQYSFTCRLADMLGVYSTLSQFGVAVHVLGHSLQSKDLEATGSLVCAGAGTPNLADRT
jgi:DNA invertase Pin-like site-specific DNA recombinase